MPRTVLTLVLVLLGAGLAAATEKAVDTPAARKAATAVRAKLPAPNPGVSVSFHGDLIIGDLWAGEMRLSAKLAKVGRSYVWRLTEDSYIDWQGGEVREKLVVHAGKDLAVVSGTYERSDKKGAVSLGFTRGKEGFDVRRRVKKGETWSKAETLVMKTAPASLGGMAAVLLFLRGATPTKGASYALPFASATAFKQSGKAEPAFITLEDRGEATWGKDKEKGKAGFETKLVRYTPGGTAWDLHLSRNHRKLIAMVSTTGAVKIVPAGYGGERVQADPRSPATTWKQAFLKFGFGYHMARKELLADAFHWPVMYEYETETLKRWSKDRPVAEFKAAWIEEFVKGSLHRDVPATRRLLSMTLATGKIKKQTDTDVVFWAHPNFGGGTQRTYYFKKVKGIWGIYRIQF